MLVLGDIYARAAIDLWLKQQLTPTLVQPIFIFVAKEDRHLPQRFS